MINFIGEFDKPFYVISDCHWFHSRLAFDFGLRKQFISIEQMNELMYMNWCETVSPEDIIFHLGDWVIGHPNKYATAQILYDSLPGIKKFLLGNHDTYLNEYTTINAYDGPISLKYKDKTILLCHEPIYDFDEDIELCGHIHNDKEANDKLKSNMFNCSVEMIGFKPILIDDIFIKLNDRIF